MTGQRGFALLLILLLLGVGALAVFVTGLNRATQQLERDRITSEALAQAKMALIGYAVSVALTPMGTTRPGNLPCPDLNDDGVAETACGNALGTTGQSLRLGRLPWKTLGLPDLRDGSGERLWYAVSTNYKKNTPFAVLNSDTGLGTITVRDLTGAIVNDGTNPFLAPNPPAPSGVIAVIIAPGGPLTRLGVAQSQSRGCTVGVDCTAQGICTTAPFSNTAKCNPVNYLDIGNGEDNADFVDNDTNGFIQGEIKDANGDLILNDKLITITYGDLMPRLEKRVASEALKCLIDYAANNQGRYPWAAPLNPSSAPNYNDVSGFRFGRVPGTPFLQTQATSANVMGGSWAGCNFASLSGWWLNWREMVFYAFADAFKPVPPVMPVPLCGTTGTCLTVNPPSSTVDKIAVVFVAGRRLASVAGGQPRATDPDKGTIANYLEGQNTTPLDDTFERNQINPMFNDATSLTP